MDRIHLKGIPCQAHVGVSDSERSSPQGLLVDVSISLSLEAAANTDDVSQTLDYAEMVDRVQETVSRHRVALIETLADRICRAILEFPRIEQVRVTVHKYPESLHGRVDHVSVELNRG